MLTRPTLIRAVAIAAAIGVAAIGYGIDALLGFKFLQTTGMISDSVRGIRTVCYVLPAALIVAVAIQFLLANKIWRGIKYAWMHWRIVAKVKHQLKDANYGIQRAYFLELPRIKFNIAPDGKSGELRIRSAVKFDSKLESIPISSALKSLVVECRYQTDDANWYVYELVDGAASYKVRFDDAEDFYEDAARADNYELVLDARTVIQLQHALIVGATGSGKTYATYSLILQLLRKPCELYFADPKGSSLAVMGEMIVPDQTATKLSEIVKLLGRFVAAMDERKLILKEKLRGRLDADYRDFRMKAHVFFLDEYASFAASLPTMEKEERENAKKWVKEIVLQGRQLGFFIMLAMQKSDATLIDTAIRDSMTLKIVLGNAETTTYITAFGAGAEIPKRNYGLGDGVFTEPRLAQQPKLVQFPVLNFDMLAALDGTCEV